MALGGKVNSAFVEEDRRFLLALGGKVKSYKIGQILFMTDWLFIGLGNRSPLVYVLLSGVNVARIWYTRTMLPTFFRVTVVIRKIPGETSFSFSIGIDDPIEVSMSQNALVSISNTYRLLWILRSL